MQTSSDFSCAVYSSILSLKGLAKAEVKGYVDSSRDTGQVTTDTATVQLCDGCSPLC